MSIMLLAQKRLVSTANIHKLESLLGTDVVKTKEGFARQFMKDEGHFRPNVPAAVLTPKTVEQVSLALKYCNQHRIPVVPFGTGTGLEGGSVGKEGDISLSMMELEGGVTRVSVEDSDCSLRPSVTRTQLNDVIRETGLFFPVDPGADASVCGMVATGASGTNAVRYGTMKENVLNVEVVLPDGSIVHTRGKDRRPRKSAAGYNLTELMVGSEGTLGVITEATVRLHPRPASLSAAVCSFPSVADAVSSVVDVLQSAIPIARIELLDDTQIAACNAYSNLDLAATPTLFLEFHGGSEEEVQQQTEMTGEICSSHSGSSFKFSTEITEMNRLWTARHNSYYAALALRKDSTGFTTDVCVPISQLTSVVGETKQDLQNSGLVGTIVGHVGDGNFHVILPVYSEDVEEMKRVKEFSNRLVRRALNVGGTCTGEHGIGIGKICYLEEELGPATMNLAKTIKKAIDPNNIMNPGKVLIV